MGARGAGVAARPFISWPLSRPAGVIAYCVFVKKCHKKKNKVSEPAAAERDLNSAVST